MGGRIKQLEAELMKTQASKTGLKEKLEKELKEIKHELDVQEKIAEKCTQVILLQFSRTLQVTKSNPRVVL